MPSGWIVGATGREKAATIDNGNGTTTHRYYQAKTCTTSPGRRARTSSSGRERFEEPGLPAVDMRLLLQPEHRNQEERHFEATRAAL